MTVKQLIRKLNKLPEDAQIAIINDTRIFGGCYRATEIDYDEKHNYVSIESDYKKQYWQSGD